MLLIAFLLSFSGKKLLISEKIFVPLLLSIGISYLLFCHFKYTDFQRYLKTPSAFFIPYLNFFLLAKLQSFTLTLHKTPLMKKFCLYLLILFLASPILPQSASKDAITPKLKDLIIVFKMHFDIGYTDLAESVLKNYTTKMLDGALLSVEATSDLPENERFVWTVPGWPVKYMLENSSSKRKLGLEKALSDGRFAVHALPFTIETESSDLENLVRSLEFSANIARDYNLPLPRDAKMTDVPSHSWIMPTLLTQAGVKILHIGCNPGSASPDVPSLFWWEGPDGSHLLTFYWAEYYGSGLMPPENWKYNTWLAMIHTHENTGSPLPGEVAALLAEAREKLPGTRVRIGQLSDFYDAIMKDNPEIPVIRGDMPDTWIHGYMSMPKEVKRNKMLQKIVYQAQNLNTLLAAWTGNTNRTEEIIPFVEKCAENMILFDEHTFGLAMSHGQGGSFAYGDKFNRNRALGYYDKIEASWREKAARIDNADRTGKMIMDEELQELAGSVKVKGPRVVVFNPHPWTRSGDVTLFMNIYRKEKKVLSLKDTLENKLIRAYNDDNLLKFYAESVPPMGYKTYIPVFGEQVEAGKNLYNEELSNTIENRYFRIKIDPARGSLISCIEKSTGRELADTQNRFGFGEYFHERFGSEDLLRYNSTYVKPGAHEWADQEMGRPYLDTGYRISEPAGGRITFSRKGNETSATWHGEMPADYPHRFSLSWILNDNLPYIRLLWNIENKQAEPLPEAGWISLPFNVKDARFHLGRTGAVVDPVTEFITGTNHDYYFVNTGLAITSPEGAGMGLNSPDAPAISLERPGLYRYSGNFKPEVANVFINLYNNQWGTNFTEWIEGNWSANIYIWSIDGYDNESGLITPTEETRQPLTGWYFDGNEGEMPLKAEGIGISSKGILVTSFSHDRASGCYLLRIWEQTGRSGPCEISLPIKSVSTATLCDLRGEPLQGTLPLRINNGRLNVHINKYQPVTLKIK
jgi:hypothetical protein